MARIPWKSMAHLAKRLPVVGPWIRARRDGQRRKRIREWLDRHRAWKRTAFGAPVAGSTRFSIITPAYDVPPPLLRELTDSVRSQTISDFEWVVVDNGSRLPECRAALESLGEDPRVRLVRIEENNGILPAMRAALEASRGDYVVPVDGDDLLEADALEVLAAVVAAHDEPALVYSDETIFDERGPLAVYARPDWDPVLNVSSSYAFHLCVYRRELGLALELYGDERANYVADWNAMLSFAAAGHQPLHVPAVLYHWRTHAGSTTNRPSRNEGSLASQRFVLEREIERRGLRDRFQLREFPIDRGAAEYWVARRAVDLPAPLVIRTADDALAGSAPDTSPTDSVAGLAGHAIPNSARTRLVRPSVAALRAELAESQPDEIVVVLQQGVEPRADWYTAAVGLFDLHPEVAMVAGRLVDGGGTVLGGAEVFGIGDVVGCPEAGRMAGEAGPFALWLKERCTSAVHPAFFLGRASFLREAFDEVPDSASTRFLGAWLGAIAARRGRYVATSPLVSAEVRSPDVIDRTPAAGERAEFLSRFGHLVPDRRFYSRYYSTEQPFELAPPPAQPSRASA